MRVTESLVAEIPNTGDVCVLEYRGQVLPLIFRVPAHSGMPLVEVLKDVGEWLRTHPPPVAELKWARLSLIRNGTVVHQWYTGATHFVVGQAAPKLADMDVVSVEAAGEQLGFAEPAPRQRAGVHRLPRGMRTRNRP